MYLRWKEEEGRGGRRWEVGDGRWEMDARKGRSVPPALGDKVRGTGKVASGDVTRTCPDAGGGDGCFCSGGGLIRMMPCCSGCPLESSSPGLGNPLLLTAHSLTHNRPSHPSRNHSTPPLFPSSPSSRSLVLPEHSFCHPPPPSLPHVNHPFLPPTHRDTHHASLDASPGGPRLASACVPLPV